MHIYRNPSNEILQALPNLPFFYIIEHVPSKRFYAGVKFRNPNAGLLMSRAGYCTSSKEVKSLIELDGYDSFRIRKIKFIEDKNKLFEYETRFLLQVDACRNPRFMNQTNNERGYGPREITEATRRKLSLAGKGRQPSKQAYENRLAGLRSAESRKKISDGVKAVIAKDPEKWNAKVAMNSKLRWTDPDFRKK